MATEIRFLAVKKVNSRTHCILVDYGTLIKLYIFSTSACFLGKTRFEHNEVVPESDPWMNCTCVNGSINCFAEDGSHREFDPASLLRTSSAPHTRSMLDLYMTESEISCC